MENRYKTRNVTVFMLVTIIGTVLAGTVVGNLSKLITNVMSRAVLEDLMYSYSSMLGGSWFTKMFFGSTELTVLWLLVALGVFIYRFYTLWYALQDYNQICCDDNPSQGGQTPNYLIVCILCAIVPFRLYTMYWFNKQGNRMKEMADRRGADVKTKGSTYLAMLLVPSVIKWVSCVLFVVLLMAGGVSLSSMSAYSSFSSSLGTAAGTLIGAVVFLLLFGAAGFIRDRVLFHVAWGVFLGNLNRLAVSASNGQGSVNGRGTVPPVQRPPVNTPPMQRPPVNTPPVQKPPVNTPPVRNANEEQPTQAVGSVKILTGQYKDAVLAVKQGEEIILGRDKSKCHLIFDNPHVSRVHCGVRYNSRENIYLITDYSTNGTFLKNGQQLRKGEPAKCRRGSVIVLGKSGEEFMIG